MPSRRWVRPWAVVAVPLRFFYPRTASPGLSPVVFRPFQTSRLHLPAPLCSTGITRLQRYYGCSDSCAWMCVWLTQPGTYPLLAATQVSPRHAHHLPGSPSPNTPPPPSIALSPVLSASQASRSSRVWASPFHRWLASRHGRIRVRHPTDCPFAFRCSPPRLATTQFRSATGRKQVFLKWTCTSPMLHACGRTMAGTSPAMTFAGAMGRSAESFER